MYWEIINRKPFYTTVQKFGVNFFLSKFLQVFYFIQQRHIILIKSDSKDIWIGTEDFYFK